MPKLKGLLDSANAKLAGLLGDFPQGFNAGAVAGFPGWAGDMAYLADTARLALTGADSQAAPEDYVGTTDYIAKQAGYPVPQTLSGQLGAAVGGLMSPGPGDLAKFAPLGAMFLGAKAKTAMPDVLEYAQAMDRAGKSADEIWQTTGKLGQPWFKGADGKWRFEIDDSARFKSGSAKAALDDTASGDVIPLSQLLGTDDELARAYPDLGNVLFERTNNGGGLYYPPNKFGTEKIEVGSRDARSTALHEVMHPIQVREGFALGGLPANSSKSAEQEYFRLAAEAEARNVQHRADLTMDERIALPPWATQDVPTEQQIVRFGDGPAMAIPFWHGSPHKFDRFDLAHMGKGEGAQAYGWGAYGAESPEVAKQYLNVDPSVPVPPRRQFMGQDLEPGTPEYHAARLASEGKESLAGLRKLVAGWISDARPGEPTDGYQKTLEILNQAQKKSDFKQLKPEPYLYRGEYRWPDPAKEAATPLTGEDLLQWDRPISEQPESVRRAVSELGIVGGNMELPAGGLDMSGGGRILDNRDGKVKPGSVAPYVLVSGDAKFDISEKDLQRMLGGSDDPTGEQIYTRLTAKLGDQNAASKALDALGAPGIRYLDGMSRDGGQGTYNYVMFDDKGIKLLERNGSPIEDFAARRAGKAKPYRELAMDEASRMQRAKEMGFDVNNPVYHGTASGNIDEFKVSGSEGGAHYFTSSPWVAGIYAESMKNAPIARATTFIKSKGAEVNDAPNIIPAYLRFDNPKVIDFGGAAKAEPFDEGMIEAARRAGHDGVIVKNVKDMPSSFWEKWDSDGTLAAELPNDTVYISLNPANIRSKFAAFDPSKKDSANLLAGLAALGVGAAAVKSQQEKERRSGL